MSPIRTQQLMKKTVGAFLQMYDEPHFPFKSLSEKARDLGLTSATATTGDQFLETNNILTPFAHDIIQASTRVNYAQNLPQIHGLETMVCMATDGAMSIEGGNWQIFDGMIRASGATVMLNTSVAEIVREGKGHFTVKTATSALGRAQEVEFDQSTYDTIVIATPLQFANISVLPEVAFPPKPISYVSLHVTLFTSPYKLSPDAFGIPPGSEVPTTILTTTPPDGDVPLTFFSISTLRTVTHRRPQQPGDELECGTRDIEYLYKIFSPFPLSSQFLRSILYGLTKGPASQGVEGADLVTWIYEKQWDSYPYLPPRASFDEHQLDEEGKIWYTSGIESFISTMETSSLMGMNVARLIIEGMNDETNGEREMQEEHANLMEGDGATEL